MKFFQRVQSPFFALTLNVCPQAQILDHSGREIVNSKDESWFATEEVKTIAENVLLYQRNIGILSSRKNY